MSEIAAIEGQNHGFLLNSHRNLLAKKIAAAQNHAARPLLGFLKYINMRSSGNVRTIAPTAHGNVTLLSDCSFITRCPNITLNASSGWITGDTETMYQVNFLTSFPHGSHCDGHTINLFCRGDFKQFRVEA
ncbi:hypothetical protein [Occallatibacter savannae]|uniref:hypothetical protein n=1 Tax=Occallatibacter savannae TaxID=1002691 RepID=UPI0013A5A8F9|nr:hypothetical protein [Occallatibacter savannae]